MLSAVPIPVVSEAAFAAEVVRGMATLWEYEGPAEEGGDLSVPLGLSAWIVRAGIGLSDASDVLSDMRAALLEASGLDQGTEPVPIGFADPRTALNTMGPYLFGLVGRALNNSGLDAVALSEAVISRLPAHQAAC